MILFGIYNNSKHKNWKRIHESHPVLYQWYTHLFSLDVRRKAIFARATYARTGNLNANFIIVFMPSKLRMLLIAAIYFLKLQINQKDWFYLDLIVSYHFICYLKIIATFLRKQLGFKFTSYVSVCVPKFRVSFLSIFWFVIVLLSSSVSITLTYWAVLSEALLGGFGFKILLSSENFLPFISLVLAFTESTCELSCFLWQWIKQGQSTWPGLRSYIQLGVKAAGELRDDDTSFLSGCPLRLRLSFTSSVLDIQCRLLISFTGDLLDAVEKEAVLAVVNILTSWEIKQKEMIEKNKFGKKR